MGIARKNQSIQDWITQQWVILFGQRITIKSTNNVETIKTNPPLSCMKLNHI